MNKIKIIILKTIGDAVRNQEIDMLSLNAEDLTDRIAQALAELEQSQQTTPVCINREKDTTEARPPMGLKSGYGNIQTVNEGLLNRIRKFIQWHTDTGEIPLHSVCMQTNEQTNLIDALKDCKTALSQVKPSVWKKYKDEKPEIHTSFISYSENWGLEILSFAREWQMLDHLESHKCKLWCYEQDLIKTIGE